MQTTAKWISDLAFDAVSDNGHIARMDTVHDSMDSGMSPKQMLLGTLCACSGMDVVSLLKKMRVDYTSFEITAQAEQTTEHPKVFVSIQMVYLLDAKPEDMDKIMKAVHLSHDKYCGVSAMLKKHCDITFEIALH